MTTIYAQFDGRVLIPEEPVNLPQNQILRVQIEENSAKETPLMALYNSFKDLPDDTEAPTDLAAQHDHYLHGAAKRP